MARGPAGLQQVLARAEREVLSEVAGPPGHQFQTERHKGHPIQGTPQRDRDHLRRGQSLPTQIIDSTAHTDQSVYSP